MHQAMKPEHWPPLLKQLAKVNGQRHQGTIRTSAFMVHTLVRNADYNVWMFNAGKNVYEEIGVYTFVGEDSLSYQFHEVESKLSNIEIHDITLPKICDDRYFFQSIIPPKGDSDDEPEQTSK